MRRFPLVAPLLVLPLVLLGCSDNTLTLPDDDDDDDAVSSPPTCMWTAPEDGAELPVGAATLRGEVADEDRPVEELEVRFASDAQGELGAASPDAEGRVELEVELEPGTHALTLTAVDRGGLECSDGVTVRVSSPPSATPPTVFPDPLYTQSVAACSGAVGSDPDGDAVEIVISWLVDGVDPGVRDVVLDGQYFSKGQTVACVATPHDGLFEGEPARSAEVPVLNTAPSVATPTIQPAEPTAVQDLLCSLSVPATDADGDALTYRFAWTVDGAPAPAYGLLGAAVDAVATVPASATANGQVWACEVTANDGEADGPSRSVSATVGCAPGSGESASCPGLSCLTILQDGFSVGDGDYWIDPTGSGAFEAWCDQTTDGGGWTRIVHDDYSVDACPGAWVKISQYGGICVRDTTSSSVLVRSATFDAWGISWTELGGSAVGHQYGSCDAFGDFPPQNVEDTYGDVLSLTVGAAGARQHVFSYVCGYGTPNNDDSNCPSEPGGAAPPGFVGADYLCDSGNQTGGSPSGAWHPQPMFAGQWFQASAGAASTQNVEGRLIATHVSSNEELGIAELTLFVR